MRESISFTKRIAGEKTEDTPSLPADSLDASSKTDQAGEGPLRVLYTRYVSGKWGH